MVKTIQLFYTLTIYFLIALLACLITGCMPVERGELKPKPTTTDADVEEEAALTTEITAVVVDPGVPFELGTGETVQLGGSNTDLTFEAIIQDGRCPIDVACVWEGEGEVQFLLTSSNGSNKVFMLKIPGLVETPFTDNPFVGQAGFRFKLLQLEPYPADEDSVQPSEYRALLLFEN